jgi:hypothetical protein
MDQTDITDEKIMNIFNFMMNNEHYKNLFTTVIQSMKDNNNDINKTLVDIVNSMDINNLKHATEELLNQQNSN